jgi:hypothetical protein
MTPIFLDDFQIEILRRALRVLVQPYIYSKLQTLQDKMDAHVAAYFYYVSLRGPVPHDKMLARTCQEGNCISQIISS